MYVCRWDKVSVHNSTRWYSALRHFMSGFVFSPTDPLFHFFSYPCLYWISQPVQALVKVSRMGKPATGQGTAGVVRQISSQEFSPLTRGSSQTALMHPNSQTQVQKGESPSVMGRRWSGWPSLYRVSIESGAPGHCRVSNDTPSRSSSASPPPSLQSLADLKELRIMLQHLITALFVKGSIAELLGSGRIIHVFQKPVLVTPLSVSCQPYAKKRLRHTTGLKNDCTCATFERFVAKVMESSAKNAFFNGICFFARDTFISQRLFAKKSAGHFEIHKSIFFVGKKIRQQRHELPRVY